MKRKLDAVLVVALAVVLWSASQGSSAECLPDDAEEESRFALDLVDAGGETGWPSEATLVVHTGGVFVFARSDWTFRGSSD